MVVINLKQKKQQSTKATAAKTFIVNDTCITTGWAKKSDRSPKACNSGRCRPWTHRIQTLFAQFQCNDTAPKMTTNLSDDAYSLHASHLKSTINANIAHTPVEATFSMSIVCPNHYGQYFQREWYIALDSNPSVTGGGSMLSAAD